MSQAMQYFPGSRSNVTGMSEANPRDATTKPELLFYLVTSPFAHRLCRSFPKPFGLDSTGGSFPGGTGTEVLKMPPYKFHIISS